MRQIDGNVMPRKPRYEAFNLIRLAIVLSVNHNNQFTVTVRLPTIRLDAAFKHGEPHRDWLCDHKATYQHIIGRLLHVSPYRARLAASLANGLNWQA